MLFLQDHAPFLKSVQHICINNPFLKHLYLKCGYSGAEDSTKQKPEKYYSLINFVIAFIRDCIIFSILKDLNLIMGYYAWNKGFFSFFLTSISIISSINSFIKDAKWIIFFCLVNGGRDHLNASAKFNAA